MSYYQRCIDVISLREKLRPGSAKNLIKGNPSHLPESSDSASYFEADKQCMALLNEANAYPAPSLKADFDRAARKVAYGK